MSDTDAPSIPDSLYVQWNPTAPWNAQLFDGDWTTITLPLRHLRFRRGIKRGQQRVEAMEFEATWGDPTRSMDPTKSTCPNYRKGRRQFRVQAWISGFVYTIARGLTVGWKPDWDLDDFWVTMTGTDRSPMLEGVAVPSVFEQVAKSLNPLWWFKMGEGGGGTLYNDGSQGSSFPATITTNPGGSVRSAELGKEKILPYTTTTSVSFAGNGSAQWGSGGDLGPPFTVACALATDATTTGFIYSQGPFGSTGDPDIALGLTGAPSPGHTGFGVDDNVTSFVEIDSDELANDSAPHFISGSYDGSVLRFKHDFENTKVGPLLAPPTPNPRKGKNVLGNDLRALNPFTGRMGHFLAWNRVISEQERTDLHNAALRPWAGLRSDQVIAKILDYVGIAGGERQLDVGQETMGPSRCDASALVCCNRPADTEGGLFFFDRQGLARFFSRNHSGTVRTPRNTLPPTNVTNIPLQDLDIDMDEATYYTVGKAYVATPDPTEVVFRHANAAVEGDLVWSPETEYADAASALAGATRAVGAGQAKPHFTNAVTIGQAPFWEDILLTEVWDTMLVTGHPAGELQSEVARVLEVEHEMDGVALTWTTTLTLEAAS